MFLVPDYISTFLDEFKEGKYIFFLDKTTRLFASVDNDLIHAAYKYFHQDVR